MNLTAAGIEAIEQGLVPDALTRIAIRQLCVKRLREAQSDVLNASRTAFFESMLSGPIALVPELANQQHYELPPDFFAAVLGPRRKYSCCYFPDQNTTLLAAEEAALEITCQRAEIHDGQQILELGCGWGSLSLWMAERFAHSQITAVSNSAPQRQFIEAEALSRGLANLRVITADINEFRPAVHGFDRVVSVEMFEHMRNYACLLQRIASWLRRDGKLFIHIFCHRRHSYPFEVNGAADWMGRYFFSGGMMPSADLISRFDRDLEVSKTYTWDGQHYQRTAAAWLANLDANRQEVLTLFARVYGKGQSRRWLNRWRTFFLAVAELFGFAGGTEWFISHYLLQHRQSSRTRR